MKDNYKVQNPSRQTNTHLSGIKILTHWSAIINVPEGLEKYKTTETAAIQHLTPAVV
jgi:hypothetical protein